MHGTTVKKIASSFRLLSYLRSAVKVSLTAFTLTVKEKKNIYIYNFYLVIEVPDHVYVLVISSSVSDCCISVFRFSWSCFIIFRLPTPFRIPRLHMCIRSACQGCRFENVPHYLCHVIRHTRIKLRCSDVTIARFSRLNFFLPVSPHTISPKDIYMSKKINVYPRDKSPSGLSI